MQQNLSIRVALSAIDKLTGPLSAARSASRGLGASIKSTQDQLRALDRQARQLSKSSDIIARKRAAIDDAIKKRDALKAEYGEASKRTDEQKASLDALDKQIAKLTAQMGDEQNHLVKVRQGFEALGVSVKEGEDLTGQITRKTADYNTQLARQEQQLKRVTAAQAAYDRAKNVAGRMRSIGVKAGAAGGAMLWGLLRGMQPGIDFDRAYSQTLANAQLSRQSREGQALREQAKRLARTTHYSAVQATEGQNALISGGMTAQNARVALPGVLNMALAAHADLGQAANVGSGIFDTFQLDASQMDRVSDVMVATFTKSKTSLESLGETMKYVGPTARQAGMSLEVTSAAAAMLAKNGLEGSMAGTGLKSVINGLYAPAKAGAEALASLHIKTTTATGAVRPMIDVLTELYRKTRHFNQGAQLDIVKTLFGEQGMGAGQILMESAVKGNFQAFQQYLERAQGLGARTAQVMTDNFSGDMQMLHAAWDGLWTSLEESADSPMRRVVKRITSVIQGVTQWLDNHKKLTAVITDSVLAMGALLVVGGSVLALIGSIIIPLAALRLSVGLLAGGEGIGALSGAVEMLGGIAEGVFGGVAAAIAGLTAPVWGIIALVATAAMAVIHWWEPIKAFLGGLFSGVLDGMRPVIEAIRREWTDISAVFSWLWDKVTQFLTPVQESKAALDKCASAGKTFGEVLGRAINLTLNPLRKLIDGLDWVLRKAGIVPDVMQYAQDKADALRKNLPPPKKPEVAVWDPAAKKMVLRPWDWSPDAPPSLKDTPAPDTGSGGGVPPAGSPPGKPEFGHDNWSLPGKKKIARGGANSTSTDAGRTGDIVFKTLPPWMALNHGFVQPTLAADHAGIISGAVADAVSKKAAPDIGTNVAGDINLHIHIDGHGSNPQALAHEVEQQVMGLLNKLKRQKLANFKDRE